MSDITCESIVIKIGPSKQIAKALGLLKYVSEKVCVKDHFPRIYQTSNGSCIACAKERGGREDYKIKHKEYKRTDKYKKKAKERYERKKDDILAYLKEHAKTPQYKEVRKKSGKKYYEKNKDKYYEYARKFRATDKGKEYLKQYKKLNPDKSYRRVTDSMPPWITDEHREQMLEIYNKRDQINKETGVLHHVDHIVPLKNSKVCGLHVPWNLQVITAKENLSKSNKWITSTEPS